MKRTVAELAAMVNGQVVGDPTITISGVSSIEEASIGDVVFVESKKYFTRALNSAASAVVVAYDSVAPEKTLILVTHPKLAFAQIVAAFAPPTSLPQGIHHSAIIAPTATIGNEVGIGAYTTIGEQSKIGNRTTMGAGCAIGANVEIGHGCTIHANVTIYDRVRIADRVIIHAGTVIGSDGFGYVAHAGEYHKFPQIGDVLIEEDVEIGSNVSIDRGTLSTTIIGRGSKIDNLVQIAHNVRIGKNCVLAAQVGVSGSSVIEDNVIVGGQVGIADHVRIETGAILGAQAGIPTGKVIRKGTLVWGTPARPMDKFKEIYAQTQNLPALKERVAELERKLAMLLNEQP